MDKTDKDINGIMDKYMMRIGGYVQRKHIFVFVFVCVYVCVCVFVCVCVCVVFTWLMSMLVVARLLGCMQQSIRARPVLYIAPFTIHHLSAARV